MNLEQTFRSAVGHDAMADQIRRAGPGRDLWRPALRQESRRYFFPRRSIALWGVESGALLIGCLFLTAGLRPNRMARDRRASVVRGPSIVADRNHRRRLSFRRRRAGAGSANDSAAPRSSSCRRSWCCWGWPAWRCCSCPIAHARQLHLFVARHFKKAQHDSVRIWTLFLTEPGEGHRSSGRCAAMSAKLISETFDVLSVTLWLLDEDTGQFALAIRPGRRGQKSQRRHRSGDALSHDGHGRSATSGRRHSTLRNINEAMGRGTAATESQHVSHRRQSPVCAAACRDARGRCPRVGRSHQRRAYTVEELELLRCIGDQISSVLLNIRFAAEVAHAKELEAFRTMSAFFVHDLKNAASSLNLMLKNLPVHFDDPASGRTRCAASATRQSESMT